MAGTFYGYAERNADSYVDWREVGQYTTDMIDETIKVRQEKKDALDQATRDALKQVSNTPIGANASARQAALEMANTVSKNLLIQEKLMKSGRLDPKDYLIYNQNALDSIDLAFNANKAYQENYQKIMDGVKSGDMSGLTLLNAAKAEEYGDWNNMGWQMSPDGNLMVGIKTEKEIDGQKVNSLDKMTSVNALNGLLLNTIPKNKLDEESAKWVGSLGKNQIATIIKAGLYRQGAVITTESILKRKDLNEDEKSFIFKFIDSEKQQINTLLGDSTNVASILFDTKRMTDSGVPYSATDDPQEAKKDPSKILRVYNPKTGGYNFEVSAAQRKEAETFAFNRMREQYDIIQKADIGSQLQDQTTEADRVRGENLKKDINTTTLIGSLYAAPNGASLTTAAKALRDINPNIQNITRTPNGVSVTLIGPDNELQTRDLPFYGPDGTLMTQEQFILSAAPLLAGNIDAKTAVQNGGFVRNGKFNKDLTVEAVVQKQAKAEDIDYTPDVEKYTMSNTSKAIKTDEATQTAANLTKLYGRLNFSFRAVEDGFTDNIIIIAPDKTESAPIPVDDTDNIEIINQFIIDKSKGQNYDKVWPGRKKQASASGGTIQGGTPR